MVEVFLSNYYLIEQNLDCFLLFRMPQLAQLNFYFQDNSQQDIRQKKQKEYTTNLGIPLTFLALSVAVVCSDKITECLGFRTQRGLDKGVRIKVLD